MFTSRWPHTRLLMRWVLFAMVVLAVAAVPGAEASDACEDVSCDTSSSPPTSSTVSGPPENPCDPMCVKSSG